MADQKERLAAALAGRYRIERELGAGGMANVYLAEDLRHKRLVALKVLKPELAAVLGAERFVHEIQTTAGLQHPHILPLYDSGEADTFLFYVMPYIEGETLRAKLDRERQLDVEEALRITRDVCDALDHAHRHGVIHRDIKPENILLYEGRPMVADFGIALAVSAAAGGRMTETGLSLGTPHYMSPEQATAEKELTGRSDIYSLACVLYEMLTGNPPHVGATAQQIIMRIVTEEAAPVTSVRKSVPLPVAQALTKALQKLPADRFASATQFAAALTSGVPVSEQRGVALGAPARVGWGDRVRVAAPWGIAVAALIALGVQRSATAPQRIVRLSIPLPAELDLADRASMAMAPDGSALVFQGWLDGNLQLFARRLENLHPEPIPGTVGASQPFFSPDGRWLAFFSGGRLRKVALTGGAPVTLAEAPTPRGGTWLDDGSIIFTGTTSQGLIRVSEDGGPVDSLTSLEIQSGVVSHRWPAAIAGSRGVLYTTYTASLGDSRIWVLDLRSGESRELGVGTQPSFVEGGYLVYVDAEGRLLAVRFDPDRLELDGTPVVLFEGIRLSPSTAAAIYSISRDGTLAYNSGSSFGQLVRVDPNGLERVLADSLLAPGAIRFSPRGDRLAMEVQEGGISSLWVRDLRRGTNTRVTFSGTARYPSWHPEGRELLFALHLPESQGFDLYGVTTDGSAPPTLVHRAPNDQYEAEWTPDARALLVRETRPGSGRDLWRVEPASGRTDELVKTPSNERSLSVSPDGRWLAYASNSTGQDEVYVRGLGPRGGIWQVSRGGGMEPAWDGRSRRIFYRGAASIMAVDIEAGEGFVAGQPRVLFADRYNRNPDHTDFAVHPTEGWFVFGRNQSGESEIVLVLGWTAELKARLKAR
jgi:Tol biopolymer transport system component